MDSFGVWPVDIYVIDPELAPRFAFSADALNDVDSDDESLDIWKENTAMFKEFIHRVTTPPYARFFSYGQDEHVAGDARQTQPTLRDESVYVRWVSEAVGYGCFANKRFEPLEPVGVYTGLISNVTENTDYAWEYNPAAMMKTSDGEVLILSVDGLTVGNSMRFVNHDSGDYQNVDQHYVPIGGIWYVLYMANQVIEPHQQLFVSYGPAYWESRHDPV